MPAYTTYRIGLLYTARSVFSLKGGLFLEGIINLVPHSKNEQLFYLKLKVEEGDFIQFLSMSKLAYAFEINMIRRKMLQ